MGFNFGEMEDFIEKMEELEEDNIKFLKSFMLEVGGRVLASTKRMTPVDTGTLRNKWELSDVMISGDDVYILLLNNENYASHVEEGHMQYARWVPGVWKGKKHKKFQYLAGSKTGMMLTTKWIPGFHMARLSITKEELSMKKRFETAFKRYMSKLDK